MFTPSMVKWQLDLQLYSTEKNNCSSMKCSGRVCPAAACIKNKPIQIHRKEPNTHMKKRATARLSAVLRPADTLPHSAGAHVLTAIATPTNQPGSPGDRSWQRVCTHAQHALTPLQQHAHWPTVSANGPEYARPSTACTLANGAANGP